MRHDGVTSLFTDYKRTAAQLRAGETGITEAVVNAYKDQIYRAALGAGLDRTRAEDVCQATFMTFLEKARTFDGRSHVRTWLFGILYNKILEAHRETRRDLENDDIDDVLERRFDHHGSWQRPPRPVDMDVHNEDVRQLIEVCLEVVPMRTQLALVLREVEGFTMNEICEILQLSRTHLGVALHRGRNRIRECLEARGMKGSGDAQL